jgi:hypothetical protein
MLAIQRDDECDGIGAPIAIDGDFEGFRLPMMMDKCSRVSGLPKLNVSSDVRESNGPAYTSRTGDHTTLSTPRLCYRETAPTICRLVSQSLAMCEYYL